MTITKEQLEEINTLKERGDALRLAKITSIPKSTMYLYMKTGECPTRVATRILKFYKKRKEERENANQILDND